MDRGPNIFENANGTKTLAWEPLQDMAREQLGHQRINQRVAVQSSQSAFPIAAADKRETRVPQVTTTGRCLPWEQGMHAQQISFGHGCAPAQQRGGQGLCRVQRTLLRRLGRKRLGEGV